MSAITNHYLEWRPKSYWSENDPIALLIGGIQGQARREQARAALADPRAPLPDELLLKPQLEINERRRLGAIHPSLLGGEYLPALLPGEIEIARVNLESTTADVISVRARPLPNGRIGYNVVNEYPCGEVPPIVPPFTEADGPLSLRELIDYIDNCVQADVEDEVQEHERGLVTGSWLWVHRESGFSPERAVTFAAAESTIYKRLASYYEELGREWAAARTREEAARREAEEREYGE